MSVSLECGLFTGTVADPFDGATVIVRVIRGRQLDPARHRAQLWQNGPLPRYSCRHRECNHVGLLCRHRRKRHALRLSNAVLASQVAIRFHCERAAVFVA